jgi:hypothetical protein
MPERRCVPRTKVFKGAKLVVPGRAAVSCIVRDLSTHGAGLQLASASDLPAEFDLAFNTGQKVRRCRIAWHNLTNVGVSFTQGA